MGLSICLHKGKYQRSYQDIESLLQPALSFSFFFKGIYIVYVYPIEAFLGQWLGRTMITTRPKEDPCLGGSQLQMPAHFNHIY